MKINFTHRKKSESAETIDQLKREQSLQRVIYQRDSEIPKSPLESHSQRQVSLLKNIIQIPFFKPGSYPPKTIKIAEHQISMSDDFLRIFQPPIPPPPPPVMSLQLSMNAPYTSILGAPPMHNYSQQSMYSTQTMPHSISRPINPSMSMPHSISNPMAHSMSQSMPQLQSHSLPPSMPHQQISQRIGLLPSSSITPYNAMNPHVPTYDPSLLANPMDPYSLMNKTRVLYNPVTKKPQNFRTVPCRRFHSSDGCERGDNCHFIHDFQFQGRPIPNFQDWKNNNFTRQKNIQSMNEYPIGIPNYFPPPGPEAPNNGS